MKYSKKLPDSLRRICWGMFMKITPRKRKLVHNNNFEAYCSECYLILM